MRIFIPFAIQDTGGTSTFARKFGRALEQRGHEVFFRFQKDYDVLLVIVSCNPLYLLHAKLRRKRIIQRLDGVYYWSVAGWKYPLLNLAPQIVHRFFSDFTIYQSQYSKYCADIFLGERKDGKFSIIYNGIDTDFFSPRGTKKELAENADQKIFLTFSKFRRKDQIFPLFEAMVAYRRKYDTNCKLVIIGDFSREVKGVPAFYRKFSYLEFVGKIKNEDLPLYARSSHVFLMTHLNPPCPNNVLEAMGCGLPICGVGDGAMKELTVPGENSLLLPVSEDAFWKRRVYDTETFSDNMHLLIQNRKSFSEKSRKRSEEKFRLEAMVTEYLKFF